MPPLAAKPLQAFRLGQKKVLVCQLTDNDPMQFVNQEFSFFSNGQLAGRITLVGISTASNYNERVFDFSYTGDEIFQQQLNNEAVITNSPVEANSTGQTTLGVDPTFAVSGIEQEDRERDAAH